MAKRKTTKVDEDEPLTAEQLDNASARLAILPTMRHATIAGLFGSKHFLEGMGAPGLGSSMELMRDISGKVSDGDIRMVSNILTMQALTLDTLFTELARRSGVNMGEHLDAADRYMRLALKAQSNSRITLEALARIHQPREQTVKHVHVTEGGQAIVADNFHHHGGMLRNGTSANQPHEQGSSGTALPGPDASGHALPIAGLEGEETVPLAWGAEPGCTGRQS